MSHIPHLAQLAIGYARRGDLQQALLLAKKALDERPRDHGLMLFIGMLHSRRLELDDAVAHVRKAVTLAPADPVPRVELIRLLIGLGKLDEAEQELARALIHGLEPLRLRAMVLARRGQPEAAAPILRQVVAAEPRDHESWGNLGDCLLAAGRPRRAAEAFARAIELRPEVPGFRQKWLEALVEAGEGELALKQALELAAGNPDVVAHQVTLARLLDLQSRPGEAVQTLRKALATHPRDLPALTAFAGLLERQNLIAEFAEAIDRIAQVDAKAPELPLLRARLAFRRGDFERSLNLAEHAPEAVDPASRAELIGKIHDRGGESDAAFRAFENMNGAGGLSDAAIATRAAALRDLVDHRAKVTLEQWHRGWASPSGSSLREPAFLLGFPRSGTTLLDTFLTGHPEMCVAEEKPMLSEVAERLGDYERIGSLDDAEVRSLRDCYFETAALHVSDRGNRLLVDKLPLGAIDAGLIHRLFPTAKIVFTLRHPCDVVLSCFITRFHPTPTLVSFQTLEDSAKLYDKVMAFWTRCRAAMPLEVHEIKYEELVRDPEAHLRALVSFLGLEWNEDVLHHDKVAERRSFIDTASYAQVAEPLYDRSIGRWKRYREQLKPVLPLLEPWALKFGYEI